MCKLKKKLSQTGFGFGQYLTELAEDQGRRDLMFVEISLRLYIIALELYTHDPSHQSDTIL